MMVELNCGLQKGQNCIFTEKAFLPCPTHNKELIETGKVRMMYSLANYKRVPKYERFAQEAIW